MKTDLHIIRIAEENMLEIKNLARRENISENDLINRFIKEGLNRYKVVRLEDSDAQAISLIASREHAAEHKVLQNIIRQGIQGYESQPA